MMTPVKVRESKGDSESVMMIGCCQTLQHVRDDVNQLQDNLDSSVSDADLLRADKVDSLFSC